MKTFADASALLPLASPKNIFTFTVIGSENGFLKLNVAEARMPMGEKTSTVSITDGGSPCPSTKYFHVPSLLFLNTTDDCCTSFKLDGVYSTSADPIPYGGITTTGGKTRKFSRLLTSLFNLITSLVGFSN